MSFSSELKRRNIPRVALAYLAAAWLLVQIAETLFPIFELSNELVRGLVIILIIGFPIALTGAWFFEFTPKGLMTTEQADAAGYDTPMRFGRGIDFAIITMLVIAVGWLLYERERGPTFGDSTIAVLPFENLTANAEESYLEEGIPREILNRLGVIEGLIVSSRRSSFRFRDGDQSAREIGAALNVSALLEGGFRHDDDLLLVDVQLVNTKDGRQVWSRSYERAFTDVYALQAEVADAVVAELARHFDIDSGTTADSAPTLNAQAYEYYLQGIYEMDRVLAPGQEDVDEDAPGRALKHFERAIELDPNFALAYIGRARANGSRAFMKQVPMQEVLLSIREDLGQAISMAPESTDVLLAQLDGAGIFQIPRERQLAIADQAIAINPNLADAHSHRARILRGLRRYRESFEAAYAARRIDPLNGFAFEAAMYADFYQGQVESIDEQNAANLALWPEANGLITEAHLNMELGRLERIVHWQSRAKTLPGFGVEPGRWVTSAPRLFGDTYLTLGLPDRARPWMTNPDMAGRYNDAILMYERRYDEALDFLLDVLAEAKEKASNPFSFRWDEDVVASIVEAYLYDEDYDQLAAYLSGHDPGTSLFPLPRPAWTNPPWPEIAYTFAMFQTGQTERGAEWLATLAEQLEHRLAEGIVVPNHFYELARIRIMQDRVPEAFTAMETAIDLGWRRWYFELDPILEPIRQLPEYAVLKGRYDADIARMRAIVEASPSLSAQ